MTNPATPTIAPHAAVEETVHEVPVSAETLIEEVSIDGMCGVY